MYLRLGMGQVGSEVAGSCECRSLSVVEAFCRLFKSPLAGCVYLDYVGSPGP